jgi:nitrate reductase NapE component
VRQADRIRLADMEDRSELILYAAVAVMVIFVSIIAIELMS